jgi:hypothetical protein
MAFTPQPTSQSARPHSIIHTIQTYNAKRVQRLEENGLVNIHAFRAYIFDNLSNAKLGNIAIADFETIVRVVERFEHLNAEKRPLSLASSLMDLRKDSVSDGFWVYMKAYIENLQAK